jgi:hypothetical protein
MDGFLIENWMFLSGDIINVGHSVRLEICLFVET